MFPTEEFATAVLLIIALLLIASTAAIFLKKIKFPYSIGLVLIGIIIGVISSNISGLEPINKIKLTPNLILYIFLPALIFQAAVNINIRVLWKNLLPVITLAVPGLVIGTLIVAGIMGYFSFLPWSAALLFGALISATDPVAVITLFESIGAPERLKTLVDGESLFNDATAIVMFQVIGAILIAGNLTAGTFVHGIIMFFTVFFGGFAVGALIGWLMMNIARLAKNDPLIEISFTTIVAYAAFIIADHVLNVSGVMSALGAGIVINAYSRTRFTEETRLYMKRFWEYAAFIANSFIFLLLGITEDYLIEDILSLSSNIIPVIVIGIIVIVSARSVVIYGLIPLINKISAKHPVPLRYMHVMFWGGLRGAVPLALALSLSSDFEYRRIIVELTLGVVLFTLLTQGTTVGLLIKMLKLDRLNKIEILLKNTSILYCNNRAEKTISDLKKKKIFPSSPEIEKKIDKKLHFKATEKSPEKNRETNIQAAWLACLETMKKTFITAYENSLISENIYFEFSHELNRQTDEIRAGKVPPGRIQVSLPHFFFRNLKVKAFKFIPILNRKFIDNQEALIDKYQYSAALYLASESIRNSFGEIRRRFQLSDEVIKKYFSQIRSQDNLAHNDLKNIISENPEYLKDVEEKVFRRIVHNTRLRELNRLYESGKIPEKVKSKLEKEFSETR